MPDGFECYNPTSTNLQCSSAMFTFVLRKSGSGTVVANSSPQVGNTIPGGKILISTTGYTNPMVAIQLPGYTIARASYAGQPSDVMTFGTDAPVSTAYSYFIFDKATTIPSSSRGIECFTGGGDKSFSRVARPMIGLKLLPVSDAVTFTGKNLAIVVPSMGGWREFMGYDYYQDGVPVLVGEPYNQTGFQNHCQLYGGALSNSNQTVTATTLSYDDVYGGPEPGDMPVPPDFDVLIKLIVVDVTGVPANTTFF